MKKLLLIILIIATVFGIYRILSTNTADNGVSFESADLVLFWGIGCPHCEKVKAFIKDTKVDQTVKISLKEIYYNKTNQKLLENVVKKCSEIDTSQGIGVPMALEISTGKCLYGDQPIIDWLQSKMLK